MLASPILSPIVLLSTIVAYQGRGALEMTERRGRPGNGARARRRARDRAAGSGGPPAAATRGGQPRRGRRAYDDAGPVTPHDHSHDHGGHDHAGDGSRRGRARALVEPLAGDFFFMGKFVVAGGSLAAMLQTGVPQSVFSGVLASPLVGSVLLMGVAFMLSLCSEADAFVAVSFIQFPPGPQLAFLVFGPVIDTVKKAPSVAPEATTVPVLWRH